MNAGRDLDALIAERIFGWKPFKRKWREGAHHGFTDSFLDSSGREIDGALPKYSTSIADAWEVVERMTAHHFKHSIIEALPGPRFFTYWVRFCEPDAFAWGKTIYGEARGTSLPEAISLAAIKAVEAPNA